MPDRPLGPRSRPRPLTTICRPTGRHRQYPPIPPEAEHSELRGQGAKTMGAVRAQFGPHAPTLTLGTTPCARRHPSADRMPEHGQPPLRSPDPAERPSPSPLLSSPLPFPLPSSLFPLPSFPFLFPFPRPPKSKGSAQPKAEPSPFQQLLPAALPQMLIQEPQISLRRRNPVLPLSKAMPLIREHHVLDRHAVLLHGLDDLVALHFENPRIVGALHDQ